MPNQHNPFSQEFIEQQRAKLSALRDQLLGLEASRRSGLQNEQENHGAESQEFEEEAQNMAQNEVDLSRQNVDKQRLYEIDRALQKIEEGNYGLSDVSGKPIPKARLEVVPEAVLTVEEEQLKESGSLRR